MWAHGQESIRPRVSPPPVAEHATCKATAAEIWWPPEGPQGPHLHSSSHSRRGSMGITRSTRYTAGREQCSTGRTAR